MLTRAMTRPQSTARIETPVTAPDTTAPASQRIDRWLCNARFFKTRGLAVDAIENGRIAVNGERAKPARLVRPGDVVRVERPPYVQEVVVLGAAEKRVGAPLAQALYRESDESIATRTALRERERMSRVVEAPRDGKLDKHDRRARERLKREAHASHDAAADFDQE